jgi:pimeloyl-ACP methyl ester carboxylesterase
MTIPQRIRIESGNARLALARWGEAGSGKPPALLIHGTGFVAEVWDEVASGLAASHTVYALDRRGHGASHKPANDSYHFLDFASDACAVIEALELDDILGVGHSAGATDLLLAATMLPRRFSRLFVMEPTIMDPRAKPAGDTGLSEPGMASVRGVLRRQAEFENAAAAFQRFRTAPAFADWSERALRAYVQHGFASLADGRVRLLCRPEIEAAMLRPIFEAMEQVYAGDQRGNPFARLSQISCPRLCRDRRTVVAGVQGDGCPSRRSDPGSEPMDIRGCRSLRRAGIARPPAPGAGGVRGSRCADRIVLTTSSSRHCRLFPAWPGIPGINPALARSSPWKPNQGVHGDLS